MNKLIFGLLNPFGEQLNALQSKMRELTIAFSRYRYRKEIFEGHNIAAILSMAVEKGADYCLIQSIGHVIDEQWYLPHWQRQGFHQSISELCQQQDFLVAGQLYRSDNHTLGIESNCILVNVSQYHRAGQPEFGEIDWQMREVVSVASEVALDDSEQWQKKKQPCDAQGWQFVLHSLEQGLHVKAFSQDINYNRFDLNVPKTQQVFAECLLGSPALSEVENKLAPAQLEFLQRAQKQTKNSKRGVFLLNIESYDDLDNEPKGHALDSVFSVAAGFKAYRILATQGFHANSQVVFFDYSQQALAVRKFIVEHWDGENFPAFVKKIFEHFPEPDCFYQLWHNTDTNNIDWQDLECLWQTELKRWGGAQSFKVQWQRFKTLPHRYMHIDVLENQQTLFDAIKGAGNSYIWWSNAFFTIYSLWHFSAQQRKSFYHQWVSSLAHYAADCRVNGADHNNYAVNGLTALGYLHLLDKQTGGELFPQALPCLDIQF
ncbi:hypothetical protein [Pseudoalteromonas byunsanensis]|uniref:Uncharacterized protein n=1 Tax=Pseudoalteromonas byunsanensis TaxID=327939 RepID=A0A1S1NGK9_9GAMM|nr:hypothetical protein [Pseudoalteromonas byunsanensis]OHU97666.1 hypothetical protein BIW53_00830 [Pseudoalteromonas byunsanensis]